MSSNDNEYCRLCAKLKSCHKLINLQDDDEIRHEISLKLTRINASTNFTDNLFPKNVCYICMEALEKAFDFVIAVEQAQQALKDTILLEDIKKEEPDSDSENIACDSNDEKYDNADVKHEDDKDVVELNSPNLNNNDLLVKKQSKVQPKKKIAISDLDDIPLSQLKLTWKDYSWMCAFCGTQFLDVDELRIHSIQYHNSCNAHRCLDCNIRKLKLDKFLIHVQRHRKFLKLSCYKCNVQFSNISEARNHRSKHISSGNICPGCNSCFSTVEDLKNHVDSFYMDKRVRTSSDIPLKSNLMCVICKKKCKNKSSLKCHQLTHTERKRDHVCEICGKGFLHKQNLIDHVTLHNDERPYHCKICKSSFKTPLHLRRHVATHDGQKPFSCDQCGRCFRLKKQLKSHSIIHTDSLPHVCVYCKKNFRFKTILNQHLRQHTGIKPYSCDICHRDFTNWPNFNKHMKRRHGTNMAKKKHTPEGVYPVNPATGDVITYPQTNETLDWKKSMMIQRKPGRPKLTQDQIRQNLANIKTIGTTFLKEKIT